VRRLEAEVNNDGFDQFFFNSPGDEAAETVAALEAIGAQKTAAILRQACAKFPGGMPPVDRDARQVILVDVVSPESHAFEQEDADFYAYEEDLSALVAAHSGTE
jgi:hypothetical protein